MNFNKRVFMLADSIDPKCGKFENERPNQSWIQCEIDKFFQNKFQRLKLWSKESSSMFFFGPEKLNRIQSNMHETSSSKLLSQKFNPRW